MSVNGVIRRTGLKIYSVVPPTFHMDGIEEFMVKCPEHGELIRFLMTHVQYTTARYPQDLLTVEAGKVIYEKCPACILKRNPPQTESFYDVRA